jgi:hypothetical protein
MRKLVLTACALACVLGLPAAACAGSFGPQGQFVGTVSPSATALIAQFRDGGPGLRAAIARLLEVTPSLADDVVFAARRANRAQRLAIGQGLADATLYFAKCGSDACRRAELQIRWAVDFADLETRVGFAISEAPTMVQGIPGFSNAGVQTNGCVGFASSPSAGSTVSPSKAKSPNC